MKRQTAALWLLCLLSRDVSASAIRYRDKPRALGRRQAQPTGTSTAPSSTVTAPIPADTDVPAYVIQYAPFVYLDSSETFWPADLQVHLNNTTPMQNTSSGLVAASDAPSPVLLDNMNDSSIDTGATYFTANQPWTTDSPPQDWVHANYGKPNAQNYSTAPCIVILVNKTGVANQYPYGDLDAFFFYFYSYNLGPNALGERFGNHYGDWEHSMVRFNNGQPVGVYVSSHDSGEAYTYDAVQKMPNGAPVVYSAVGDHSTYATPGNHEYVTGVPFLNDYSIAGVPWNVSLNSQYFWYSPSPNNQIVAATGTTYSPNFLLSFAQWGNMAPNSSNPYQQVVLGFQRFSDGPPGPITHTLIRTGLGFDANQTIATTLPQIINGTGQDGFQRALAPSFTIGRTWLLTASTLLAMFIRLL